MYEIYRNTWHEYEKSKALEKVSPLNHAYFMNFDVYIEFLRGVFPLISPLRNHPARCA